MISRLRNNVFIYMYFRIGVLIPLVHPSLPLIEGMGERKCAKMGVRAEDEQMLLTYLLTILLSCPDSHLHAQTNVY